MGFLTTVGDEVLSGFNNRAIPNTASTKSIIIHFFKGRFFKKSVVKLKNELLFTLNILYIVNIEYKK